MQYMLVTTLFFLYGKCFLCGEAHIIDLIDYVTGIGNGSRAPLYRNS